MRLDRFQAWDPAEIREGSAYLTPHVPFPAPDLPSPTPLPHRPLASCPPFSPLCSPEGHEVKVGEGAL